MPIKKITLDLSYMVCIEKFSEIKKCFTNNAFKRVKLINNKFMIESLKKTQMLKEYKSKIKNLNDESFILMNSLFKFQQKIPKYSKPRLRKKMKTNLFVKI